jgi:hypothetical protein
MEASSTKVRSLWNSLLGRVGLVLQVGIGAIVVEEEGAPFLEPPRLLVRTRTVVQQRVAAIVSVSDPVG